MSISNFSLVNQKLAFVNSLCMLAQEPSSSGNSAQRLRQDAILSSCVLQLSLAFHFYLREIADRSLLKDSNFITSLDGLESSLAQQDKSSSEVAELREIAGCSGSWLEQLWCYEQAAWQSPVKEKAQKTAKQDNLILAVDITAAKDPLSPLTIDLVTSWLEQFRSLVLRQRDINAEF